MLRDSLRNFAISALISMDGLRADFFGLRVVVTAIYAGTQYGACELTHGLVSAYAGKPHEYATFSSINPVFSKNNPAFCGLPLLIQNVDHLCGNYVLWCG